MPKAMPKVEMGDRVNVLHYVTRVAGRNQLFDPVAIPSQIVAIEPVIRAERLDGELYPTLNRQMPLLPENYGDLWHLVDDHEDIDFDLLAATTGVGPTSVTQPAPAAWGLPPSPQVTRD